jgi:Fe-S-cluster-containing hydrogenase component 2
MDVIILYESITGNTRLGVEVIRLALEKMGHSCSAARFSEISPSEIGGHDLYCFATPIQSYAPMATAWRFLRELPQMDGAPAFIFSSCGGIPGAAHALVARQLQKHGFVVIGNHYLICETSFPILRAAFRKFFEPLNLPSKRALLKLVDFAGEMAGKAERLRKGVYVELPTYRLVPGLTLPLALHAVRGGLSRTLGKRSVDMDACDLCGICAENCPVSAITLDDMPVFDKSCIGCWGCFNICPRAAILTNIVRPSSYYGGVKNKASRLSEIGLAPRD